MFCGDTDKWTDIRTGKTHRPFYCPKGCWSLKGWEALASCSQESSPPLTCKGSQDSCGWPSQRTNSVRCAFQNAVCAKTSIVLKTVLQIKNVKHRRNASLPEVSLPAIGRAGMEAWFLHPWTNQCTAKIPQNTGKTSASDTRLLLFTWARKPTCIPWAGCWTNGKELLLILVRGLAVFSVQGW